MCKGSEIFRSFYAKCRDAKISGTTVFHLTDSETKNVVSRWTAITNVGSANLQTRSQYESWKSSDPSSQSRFGVVFLGFTTNAELAAEIHIALHSSHAAVPASTSKFPTERSSRNVYQLFLDFQRHLKFTPNAQQLSPAAYSNSSVSTTLHSALPITLHCYQPTIARRMSGHRLGTFGPYYLPQ